MSPGQYVRDLGCTATLPGQTSHTCGDNDELTCPKAIEAKLTAVVGLLAAARHLGRHAGTWCLQRHHAEVFDRLSGLVDHPAAESGAWC